VQLFDRKALLDRFRVMGAALAKKADRIMELEGLLHSTNMMNELLRRQINVLLERHIQERDRWRVIASGHLGQGGPDGEAESVGPGAGPSGRLSRSRSRSDSPARSHSGSVASTVSSVVEGDEEGAGLGASGTVAVARLTSRGLADMLRRGALDPRDHVCSLDVSLTLEAGDPLPFKFVGAPKVAGIAWSAAVADVTSGGDPDACCGVLRDGMVVVAVNGVPTLGLSTSAVAEMVRAADRPVTFKFRELSMTTLQRKYQELQSRCARVFGSGHAGTLPRCGVLV
jgi:hypothetical protein